MAVFFGQPLLSEIITEFDPYDITLLNEKECQKIVDDNSDFERKPLKYTIYYF